MKSGQKNSDYLEDFNNFISEKVYFYEKQEQLTHEQIASYLNVTESYIKKVNSRSYTTQHYNLFHLWKLSQKLNVKIENFLPPQKNGKKEFEEFKRARPEATSVTFENFLKKYKSSEETNKYE